MNGIKEKLESLNKITKKTFDSLDTQNNDSEGFSQNITNGYKEGGNITSNGQGDIYIK